MRKEAFSVGLHHFSLCTSESAALNLGMIWNAALQKGFNSAEVYSSQQTTVGSGSACHRTKAILSLTWWYVACRFSFGSTSREMWLWFPSLSHLSALWRTSRCVSWVHGMFRDGTASPQWSFLTFPKASSGKRTGLSLNIFLPMACWGLNLMLQFESRS